MESKNPQPSDLCQQAKIEVLEELKNRLKSSPQQDVHTSVFEDTFDELIEEMLAELKGKDNEQ